MGYHRAGFDVVGVDIAPQPHYPFEFYQMDALTCLRNWRYTPAPHDAIHASPPCQAYSTTASLHDSEHPDLYEPTRDLLMSTGLPWVIENVVGAPYGHGILLCGGMFGLRVRRHRNFESSHLIPTNHHCCPIDPIDVTGTGARRLGDRADGGGGNSRKPLNLTEAREAMGIDWMTRKELSQAIPPAYTEFIGSQLLANLKVAS